MGSKACRWGMPSPASQSPQTLSLVPPACLTPVHIGDLALLYCHGERQVSASDVKCWNSTQGRKFPAGDSKETARAKECLGECSYHFISLSIGIKVHCIDGSRSFMHLMVTEHPLCPRHCCRCQMCSAGQDRLPASSECMFL